MARIRTFIAIDTPVDIKVDMSALQQKLKESAADVRWESSEKFHATIKFLGDTEESRLDDVVKGMETAAGGVHPFRLTYEGLGTFPDRRHPRVIWIGCHNEDGSLESFKTRLDGELTRLGFDIDDRPFRPHVTLGRVKSEKRMQYLLSILENLTFDRRPATIGGILFVKSLLRPQGAEYSLLHSIQLS